VRRAFVVATCMAIAAVGAWQGASAIQNVVTPRLPTPKPAVAPAASVPAKPQAGPKAPQIVAPTSKITPMAERVVTVGLLNKRNGLSRDLVMKPGEAVRIGDVVIRVKACETSAPWEVEKLTGAFVQVIVHGSDDKWRRAFSGWLFKESPSLNVVEHPIYDVWTKDCAMRHPDTGPDTLVVRGGEAPKEKKSGSRRSADDNDTL
jgi:hypothetical protein